VSLRDEEESGKAPPRNTYTLCKEAQNEGNPVTVPGDLEIKKLRG